MNQLERKLYHNGFMPFQRKRQDSTKTDWPLRQTADLYITQANITGDNRLALEEFLDSSIVQEYGTSLEDLSTWWWNDDRWAGKQDYVLPEGYTSLVELYASSVRNIQLNATVSSIDYRNSIAIVTYTQDGIPKSIKAQTVIITVPLGVLQNNTISFLPSLPSWKNLSINNLGMGLYNKCIMKWSASTTLPWPSNVEWLQKICPLGKQGQWSEYYNLEARLNEKILVAFTAGREAERVEALSDDEIKSEVLASLQSMFGKVIPTPDAMLITRQQQNEFTRGS